MNSDCARSDKTDRTFPFAVAIHGGAGVISKSEMTPEKEAAHRAKLTEALQAGQAVLEADGTSLDAVIAAIKILEDSPLFNAGKGAVLTGDALMIGGSGRCDFPGVDAGAQYDAVTRKLFELPEETVVWPAHDYKGNTQSTIGRERRENPRFLGKTREQYVELMAKLGLPFPDKIQQALQVNQSGFEPGEVGFPLVAEVAGVPPIKATELAAELRSASPPLLLDVREPEEFVGELGHIVGSLLVPMDALERRLPKLAGYVEREVVLVCRAGARSASAGAILTRAGFANVKNLEGGMLAWSEAGLPTQK